KPSPFTNPRFFHSSVGITRILSIDNRPGEEITEQLKACTRAFFRMELGAKDVAALHDSSEFAAIRRFGQHVLFAFRVQLIAMDEVKIRSIFDTGKQRAWRTEHDFIPADMRLELAVRGPHPRDLA